MNELKCPCGLRNHMDSKDCRKTLCRDCCPLQKNEKHALRPGRLTLPHYGGKGYYMKCSESLGCSGKCEDCEDLDALVDRLAAYEDTGLDPENMAHWQEFFLAECDGRLVVLPCKVGDTVWFIRPGDRKPEITETTIEKMVVKSGGIYMKLACNAMYETSCRSIGKTVFLTREEAEKALEVPHET